LVQQVLVLASEAALDPTSRKKLISFLDGRVELSNGLQVNFLDFHRDLNLALGMIHHNSHSVLAAYNRHLLLGRPRTLRLFVLIRDRIRQRRQRCLAEKQENFVNVSPELGHIGACHVQRLVLALFFLASLRFWIVTHKCEGVLQMANHQDSRCALQEGHYCRAYPNQRLCWFLSRKSMRSFCGDSKAFFFAITAHSLFCCDCDHSKTATDYADR
jgi:hypothetical protein